MRKNRCEVVKIRRFWNLITLLVLLLILAQEAWAAAIQAGTVTTASGSLNVRAQPTGTGAVLGSLKRGSYVTVHSADGQWWRVEYEKGKFGYSHSGYLTAAEGRKATVEIRSGSLNVRSGAGTGYPRVAGLFPGETVLVLDTGDGWSRILYHGTKTGYVSSQYLSGYYPAVSVWAPDYKQMDTRWADKTVGSSGKTFSQIGCATTAAAMLESARQGKQIYPDELSRQLRYTPTGDLYWPSHYIADANPDNYLEKIYRTLSQGKPVLLGQKNGQGAQHWVVVTGFRGGDRLTEAGFTIHDPGTYSRTLLSQLLSAYPTFYKRFTYG